MTPPAPPAPTRTLLDRTGADLVSRAALADTEIVRLTSAWRTLLAAHQPDEHGQCPECRDGDGPAAIRVRRVASPTST
ncbi:MAG TPA: hypothetical protein VGL02_21100 [Streptomyces sp.]